MKILVLNSGSSSIKYKLYKENNGKFDLLYGDIQQEVKSFHKGFESIFSKLLETKMINSLDDINCVGHRVVHGGEEFSKPILVDEKVIKKLEQLIPLAPLHNPSNIDGIKTIKEKLKDIPQVVVFDTAFHHTLPKKNFIYPIPLEYYNKYKIRRYGFHGTSVEYVANRYAKSTNKKLEKLNLIVLHLGNGASITAIKKGKSHNTSMGFTPLEGLMMGTRSGDIDPSIISYLEKTLDSSADDITNILNKNSGFKGLTNKSDLRDILKDAKNNDTNSKLALKIYISKIRKYLSSYIYELKKIDAIIFTGGIGENSKYIRKKVLKGIENIVKNKVDIKTIKTNEELNIAIQTYKTINKGKKCHYQN